MAMRRRWKAYHDDPAQPHFASRAEHPHAASTPIFCTGPLPPPSLLAGGMLVASSNTAHAAVVWSEDGAAAVLHIDSSACVTGISKVVPATPTPCPSNRAFHGLWTCLPETAAKDPLLLRVAAVPSPAAGKAAEEAKLTEPTEDGAAAAVPTDTVVDVVALPAMRGDDIHTGSVDRVRYSDAWKQCGAGHGTAADVTTAVAVGGAVAPTLLVQVRACLESATAGNTVSYNKRYPIPPALCHTYACEGMPTSHRALQTVECVGPPWHKRRSLFHTVRCVMATPYATGHSKSTQSKPFHSACEPTGRVSDCTQQCSGQWPAYPPRCCDLPGRGGSPPGGGCRPSGRVWSRGWCCDCVGDAGCAAR